MKKNIPDFTAVVLAGDREPQNPVAQAAGVPCKVLASVGGKPMLLRVVNALESSAFISSITVCGPDRSTFKQSGVLQGLVASNRITWLEADKTPSTSAWRAMESIPKEMPVLLTTGDHALLTSEITDFFCGKSVEKDCDVTVALSLLETVTGAFPHTHRTAYRFKEGAYCSCNLFSFLTPEARNAALFWRKVEAKRKNPLKVINSFGWIPAIKYLAGQLTLSACMKRVSRCMGCRAGAVIMPFPEAAVDVDTPEDLAMVNEIINT